MTTTKKKILLVEDTEPLRRALVIKLRGEGFDVIEAINGSVGLQMFEAGQFDLIITDLVMPERNGLEFLADIKARGNRTPVMVLSNVSRLEEQKIVADLGVDIYMVKVDTSLATLVAKIKELFPQGNVSQEVI